MFANKILERKILQTNKKANSVSKSNTKKATTKTTTKAKTKTIPKATQQKIDQQKLNYNLARANNNVIGERVANVEANKIRKQAKIPTYSSAKGDMQHSLTVAKTPTAIKQIPTQSVVTGLNQKVPTLSPNHPLNRANKTVSPIPTKILGDMFDKKENYVDKFKKGNIGGGVASLAGETAQMSQSLLTNLANNVDSVSHGKGLQPYKRMMDHTDYENEIGDRNNVKPLSQLIGEKNKTLGNLYSMGMNIATDPLNLLDVGAVQTAKGLKVLGSAKYADNLAKGSLVKTVGEPTKNVASIGGKVEAIPPSKTALKSKDNYANDIVDELAARHNPRNLTTSELKKRDSNLSEELGKVANMSDKEFRQYAKENVITKSQLPYLHEAKIIPTIPNKATDNVLQANRTEIPKANKNVVEGNLKELGADTNRTERTLQDDITRSGEKGNTGIPNSTPYGDVSKHAQTVIEGEQYSDNTNKEILKSIADGGFTKVTKTNKVAYDNAQKTIDSNFDDAYIKFKNVSIEGKHPTSENIALGYQLAKKFDDAGEFEKASDVLEDVTLMLSETGRTLQAAKMAMKNTPLGRQKIVAKIAKKISEKTGINVKLSDGTLAELMNAKTEKEVSKAFDNAKLELWGQTPPTFSDKFNAWRYTAMLGNTRTVFRNEIGNAFSYMAKEVKDIIGTGIEKSMNIQNGERTKAILTPKDNELIKAGREIARERIDDLRGIGKYSDLNEGSRPQELPIFGQNKDILSKSVGKVAEKWRTTTNKALEDGIFKVVQGDAGWLTRVYGNAFAKVLKANKWTLKQVKESPELLEKAHEIAKIEAQRATFRDANSWSDAISKVSGRLRNSDKKLNKAAGYAFEAVMPFKKTPANILKRSAEYSPIGLVKSGYDLIQATRKGGDVVTAIDRLSAGLTGSSIAVIGGYLASQGIVNVTIKNDKEGDYEKLKGEQPYSLNVSIGGKDYSYTLDWLTPASVPLFLGAELYNTLNKNGASASDIVNSFSNIVDPIFEMSMLQGITNMFDVGSYTDDNVATKVLQTVGNMGFSLAGQTVPTLGGQVARITDKSNRRTNSSGLEGDTENYIAYNVNKNIISKIPFANQLRQEYVDQWGRTKDKNGAGSYARSFVENLASPGYTSDKKVTAVDKEITSLYELNGNKEILPPEVTGYTVKHDGTEYRMDSKEYVQFKKTKGQYALNELDKLFSTSEYKSMTAEDKEKAVKAVYDESTKKAKGELLVSKGVNPSDVWFNGLGKKTIAAYDSVKDKVSPEEYYTDYYKTQKSYSSQLAKAMALKESNVKYADEVLSAMDISKMTTNKAQFVLDSGISAEQYNQIRKDANADGESLKKIEVLKYLNSNGYTDEQKRAILRTI